MKRLSIVTILLLIFLGLQGCPPKTNATEAQIRKLVSEKRELIIQAKDKQVEIDKVLADKQLADQDEAAINKYFHPKVATSAGVKK
jgi:hypothetical protein